MLDLQPTRERALSLSRSWNVLHTIDASSPLAGETPASVVEKEVELQVMVIGIDDISMQTVHATHRYFAKDIVWGARMADVLTETPDGHMLLDLRRFHDVEPTRADAGLPVSDASAARRGRGARASRRRRRRVAATTNRCTICSRRSWRGARSNLSRWAPAWAAIATAMLRFARSNSQPSSTA